MDLGEICRYWARWQPEAAAVDCEGPALTWRELHRRTDAIAAGLAERGLGAGERLGILGQNSTAWIGLEGTSIGAALQNSGSAIACLGWEDNI